MKIGSCADPLVTITRLRKAAPYRLYVDYIGFTRADLCAEVELAAKATLVSYRVQNDWIDCAPELAVAATATAARRLGYGMILTNLESVEEVLRSATWVSVSNLVLRRRRSRRGHGPGRALATAWGLGALVTLIFAFTQLYPDFDARVMIGPCILVAMVAALVLSQQLGPVRRN